MAVAETGSLSGAATRLCVNASTVFRRLRQLETQLSTPLFQRHRTRYELTAAGIAVVELAHRIDEDIDSVVQSLSEDNTQPTGELRLTTNDTLLFHVLMPMLIAFKKQQPKIRIKITIDNNALNLATSDSDVALRATDAPPENLAGRCLGRTNWDLYGRSMDYTNRILPRGAEILQCDWVTLCDNLSSLSPAKFIKKNIPTERVVFSVNSVLSLADAIEAGFGIGYLPCFVGDARDSLVKLEGPLLNFGHDLWFLFHPHMRRSAIVREFINFATRELKIY
ncbi:LysR family transcriptional regulator [Pseudomonas agarici]|nr:LysR family transcriptional regulator [Pseudomonas agarici]